MTCFQLYCSEILQTLKWHKFLTADNVLCVKNALHEPMPTQTVENIAVSSGWKYNPTE